MAHMHQHDVEGGCNPVVCGAVTTCSLHSHGIRVAATDVFFFNEDFSYSLSCRSLAH